MIHKLLNVLDDNFVDYPLLGIDDYYNLWLIQIRKNLINVIYLGEFKGVIRRIGDFLK